MVGSERIKEIARDAGIDDLKIAPAARFDDACARIVAQAGEGLFLHDRRRSSRDISDFCDPGARLAAARSVITACLFYLTDEPADRSEPGDPHGLIARYTWRNYYRELKNRLRRLASFLTREYRAACCFFSNGPVAEKPAAERAGLGYYGRHGIIINPRYGSWIVLGEIITDLEIEPDAPLAADCGGCRECIAACPTGAIIRPYVIDRSRCIQALASKPGILPEDIMAVWGRRLYGCSTCQDVCPVNRQVLPGAAGQIETGFVGPSLSLREFIALDERRFRRIYSGNQLSRSWIALNTLKRNAILALRPATDPASRQLLNRLTRREDPVLAETARWAEQWPA